MAQTALHRFFTDAHTLRGDTEQAVKLFQAAYKESQSDAIALAFYMRDVRQGYGEREIFRAILKYMADFTRSSQFIKLIPLIPEYGRWDDLLILGPHRYVGMHVVKHIRAQYMADLESAHPSLLGKYMFSENASSEITKTFADYWMRMLILHGSNTQDKHVLNIARRTYRKSLSTLRARLDVVERQMSSRRWDQIDYTRVPARAMHIYYRAFMQHDRARFTEYMKSKPMNVIDYPVFTTLDEALLSDRLTPIYDALRR